MAGNLVLNNPSEPVDTVAALVRAVHLDEALLNGGVDGDVLTSNGPGEAPSYQASSGGGGVSSLNGKTGVIVLEGYGGISIGADGNNITLEAPLAGDGYAGIVEADGTSITVNDSGVISATPEVSGLTAGFIPLAGSASTITGDSHIDDGITTSGTITSTEPFTMNDGTGIVELIAGLLNQNFAATITPLGSSGTLYVTMPFQGTALKLVVIVINPTDGEANGATEVVFPVPFAIGNDYFLGANGIGGWAVDGLDLEGIEISFINASGVMVVFGQ